MGERPQLRNSFLSDKQMPNADQQIIRTDNPKYDRNHF